MAAQGNILTHLKESQEIIEAESVLLDLAGTFFDATGSAGLGDYRGEDEREPADARTPNLEAKYRALLEQMPAVVFMADLDRGISEAYVSPQIEAALGYSREQVAGRSGPLVPAYSS